MVLYIWHHSSALASVSLILSPKSLILTTDGRLTVYVISFLASLNMRGSMRAALHASTPLEMEPRSGIPFSSKRSQGTEIPLSTQLSIKIDTISEFVVDPKPAAGAAALAPEGRRWSRPWALTGPYRRDRSSDRVVVPSLPSRGRSPGAPDGVHREYGSRCEKPARDQNVEGGYAI